MDRDRKDVKFIGLKCSFNFRYNKIRLKEILKQFEQDEDGCIAFKDLALKLYQ